jgi:hypothetical protein
MTRYYIYHVKSEKENERLHAFVEDPILFALKIFDPAKMEFSGVFVEAEDTQAAEKVYTCPQENDVLVSCEEPRATILKRQAFESRLRLAGNKLIETMDATEREMRRLRINTIAVELGMHFSLMASQVSELARQIRAIASVEDRLRLSNEQVYERLIEQYSQQLLQLKYRPGLDGKIEG